MRYCTLQTVVTVLRWHCLKTEGDHEATLLEAGQQHLHVTTGSSSFSGCASYLGYCLQNSHFSGKEIYQENHSFFKFKIYPLAQLCQCHWGHTSKALLYSYILLICHYKMSKLNRTWYPRLLRIIWGQNQQAMHSSLWHRSFTWHRHIGPAPNHPGGIWWLEERS